VTVCSSSIVGECSSVCSSVWLCVVNVVGECSSVCSSVCLCAATEMRVWVQWERCMFVFCDRDACTLHTRKQPVGWWMWMLLIRTFHTHTDSMQLFWYPTSCTILIPVLLLEKKHCPFCRKIHFFMPEQGSPMVEFSACAYTSFFMPDNGSPMVEFGACAYTSFFVPDRGSSWWNSVHVLTRLFLCQTVAPHGGIRCMCLHVFFVPDSGSSWWNLVHVLTRL